MKNKSGEHSAPAQVSDHPVLELEHFVPYRLAVLAHLVSRSVARAYRDRFGLSVPEWRVMASLGQGKAIYANDLVETSNIDKVQASRALTRLQSAGLIDRRVDETDRRRALISLTDKGWDVYRQIVPRALGYEAKLLEQLTEEEQACMDRVIGKMTAYLRGLEKDGAWEEE
ncbi:MarR family winged helix-turn-helix transcriptional regulator [Telmatospirillum sp. J64-1]|uniref:MarR family winged helix-turn-helix transcriptional regulator n=1 Tax=Telmatospirillum sp. J64-1 TaxID=2502183 RepID=UPI00115D5DC0|nr:MarR family transcriptional regulator [Telmatospirillum sp. J64-1]